MSKYFPQSEQVATPEKPPCEQPRRRRCLDIEYKRRHGCADKWDLVLFLIIGFMLGFGLGLLFKIAGAG